MIDYNFPITADLEEMDTFELEMMRDDAEELLNNIEDELNVREGDRMAADADYMVDLAKDEGLFD